MESKGKNSNQSVIKVGSWGSILLETSVEATSERQGNGDFLYYDSLSSWLSAAEAPESYLLLEKQASWPRKVARVQSTGVGAKMSGDCAWKA